MSESVSIAVATPAVSVWAKRINSCWRIGIDSIFETGRQLAAAKEAMPHGEWEWMCEYALTFKPRTATRLIKIAEDERLSNPTHVSLLPNHWGTLYELTKLDDDALAAGFKDGTINPDLERATITQRIKIDKRAERERELGEKQCALPDKKFGVIVADPEWRFEPWSRSTGMDRAADNHYPTSCTEVIAARDVASIAADDCVLFLWATAPMLPHALLVMAAWGFDYRSHMVWIKDHFGTGYWFRGAHELLLVGARGKITAPAPGTQRSSWFEGETGVHSAKPEIVLEMIERWFPTLPKIELNRRGPPRDGWSAWGNESENATTVPSSMVASGPASSLSANRDGAGLLSR